MKIPAVALSVLGFVALASASPGRAAEPYRFLKEIPVGGDGFWDYLSVDPVNHRLYVSHATKVVVIDTQTDAIVGEIADTPGVHGIATAPQLGRGFVSNGRENTVSVVDLATFKTLSRIPTEKNPDSIVFVPGPDEVYAFNGHSQSVTVISAASGRVVTAIPLGGKPEFAQADPAAGRVYDNLEDKSEVAVLDAKTHSVVARWPIAPGLEASGMAIDLVHHRLFLGCSNAMMIVLDSTDGHVVASLAAGKGIDAAAFDPGTQYAFTSNGRDGTVTIVHEDAPDRYTVVQTLATQLSARTMAVDPISHKIYLSAAKFGPALAGSRQRPPMIPGTFKVMVYELKQ